jgi:hypothetical protein
VGTISSTIIVFDYFTFFTVLKQLPCHPIPREFPEKNVNDTDTRKNGEYGEGKGGG